MKTKVTDQDSFLTYAEYTKLPPQYQPVNRLREVGPQGLSTVELIAILTGDQTLGVANAVFAKFPTLRDLVRAPHADLTGIPGVGKVAAARLYAGLELARRLSTEDGEDKYQVRSPSDAANLLMPKLGHEEQEHFVILFLDTRNRITGDQTLYKGSLNTSLVRVCEVFREAVRRNVAGVIVAHNHPSGDPNPSPEDVALTRRLVEAGKLLEIDVLDHLVIGQNRFVSLRERGLGFDGA